MTSITVLVGTNDDAVAEWVRLRLEAAGYRVVRVDVASPNLRLAAAELEPDCVLLDGERPAHYGQCWDEAAWLQAHHPFIPVIMYTASWKTALEARERRSERACAASFARVLLSPFHANALLSAVGQVVGTGAEHVPSGDGRPPERP